MESKIISRIETEEESVQVEPTLHDWMFMGGLLLEVIGAFFLAKGAMVKSIRDIIRDTSTWYGATEGARNHEIREQVNSWLGAITLLLGLATQFVGEALRFVRPSAYVGGAAMAAVLLCVLMSKIAWRISLKRMEKGHLGLIFQEILDAEKALPRMIDPAKINRWGEKADVRRHNGEPDEEYLLRIKARIYPYRRYAPFAD